MASYKGHLTFSTALGVAFGGVSVWQLGVDWPIAAVGGLLTALGGLLPDLDSDSGVPVREMTNLTATAVPLVLLRRIAGMEWTAEQAFLTAAGVYLFIRFVLFNVFRKVTVHRGMFHSIPAMLIAGLGVFLACEHPSVEVRGFLAVGIMLGFLSHLVLDELCSVDLNGVVPKLNHFAGTAVKFWSASLPATAFTYMILAGLGYEAYREVGAAPPVMTSTAGMVAQGQPASPPPAEAPKRLGFTERQHHGLEWFKRKPSEKRPAGGVSLSVPNRQ